MQAADRTIVQVQYRSVLVLSEQLCCVGSDILDPVIAMTASDPKQRLTNAELVQTERYPASQLPLGMCNRVECFLDVRSTEFGCSLQLFVYIVFKSHVYNLEERFLARR